MKLVLQRVKQASVLVDNKTVGEISHGFLILLGVHKDDGEKEADWLSNKLLGLRLFDSDDGSTFLDKDIKQVSGEILIISQFTLFGDCKKGTRPSFSNAASPEKAEKLYEYFVNKLRESGTKVETGKFAAKMQVKSVNNGPITLVLEAEQRPLD